MSRGKDKGKGFTFSLEAIGLTKGDAIPNASLVPPPLYPSLPVKPLPLLPQKGDNYQYLCDVKQDLASAFRSSKYYLVQPKTRLTIQRYSDKFEESSDAGPLDNSADWNWRIFPDELRPKSKKSRKKQEAKTDILKKLDLYDANDDEKEDEETEEKEENEEENGAAEEEEDIEEETDYGNSYFDNGEKYMDDSDDNLDEGPTY